MAEQGRAQGRTQGYAGTWPPRDAARAGGIAPSGLSAWPSLIDKSRMWIRAEAGAGRLLPWVPVAFGTGIALYFTADREPVLSVVAVVAIGLCAAAFLLRRYKIFPIAVMIAAIAAGFAIATWKTARVAHGVLARPIYSVSLSLRPDPRHPRAYRPLRVARRAHGKPEIAGQAGARSAVSAQGHRTRGR